jgi:pimeloyl-[acyl-carrier protein] methyl ester esterase
MLHVTTTGSGPNLVLLHGWGLNASVWSELRTRLEPRWRVTCIDLPGHGGSRAGIDLRDLDVVCAALHRVAPPAPAVWLGWSMGGLIAIAYALRYPQQVRHLILVASQPRFVRAPDWPHGMAGDLLDDFNASLERAPRKTLARFLALQVRGSENPARTLRRLHAALTAGAPDPASLKSGLALLRDTDMREQLALLTCPLRLILGERDMLVPATAGPAITALIDAARYRVIARAGHAPFLSHVDEFTHTLEDYLDN